MRKPDLLVCHVLEVHRIATRPLEVGVDLGDVVRPAPEFEGAVMFGRPRFSLGFGAMRRNLACVNRLRMT